MGENQGTLGTIFKSVTFHQIQIGQKFRKKPEYHYFEYLKTAVWEKTEFAPSVEGKIMGTNAVYVSGEHSGLRVHFPDDPKLNDDYYEII